MRTFKVLGFVEASLSRKLAIYLIIFAAALAAYCNSFNAPFQMDDFGSISNNYSIHSLFDFKELWKFYANRVVVYFSFSLNYLIHDTGVQGYHITNLAIHILNGILLYHILNYLLSLSYFSKNLISRYSRTVSLFCAILFITHPIQVNAVTYVVQRTASLAATFYLLSILYYIKFRLKDTPRYLVFTFIFIILAMFTKENTITIPFMLIIIEVMFFAREKHISWKKRSLIIVGLLLTIPLIPLTNLLLSGHSLSDPNVTFKASTSMDRMHYFYTQLNVIVLYIKLMFIPDYQNFDYSNDFPISATIWENYSYVSSIIILIPIAFSFFTYKRNRLVTLGIWWFFAGLAVESSFISIKDVYFEHRLYFPCAGFTIFLIGMIFFKRNSNHKRKYLTRQPFVLLIVVGLVLSLTFTALTLRRNYIYSDSIRLWNDTVDKAPGSDRAHSVLATAYLNAYNKELNNTEYLDIAMAEFNKSIEISNSNSTAHVNLAKVYYYKKEYEKCIEEARIALSISQSTYAYHNIGLAFQEMNDIDNALKAYEDGYKIDNKSTFLIRSLADLHLKKDETNQAAYYYKEFLKYCLPGEKKVVEKIILDNNL